MVMDNGGCAARWVGCDKNKKYKKKYSGQNTIRNRVKKREKKNEQNSGRKF